MKFSREFYFRASFFRAFYFRAPPFFSFSRKTNFHALAKKVWFNIPNVGILLVFSERKKKKNQNMSFKNREILFSRTSSCANHSNSRGLYISAGALHENKTHAKISWTKVYDFDVLMDLLNEISLKYISKLFEWIKKRTNSCFIKIYCSSFYSLNLHSFFYKQCQI